MSQLPKSMVALEVALSEHEVRTHLVDAVRSLAQSHEIPGFRPGNAPEDVVRRRVGDEKVVQETRQRALTASYARAIREKGLLPIAEPRVDIIPQEGEGMRYRATVPVYPTVTLPAYDSIPVSRKDVRVNQNDVDPLLKKLQESRATELSVSRGAQKGDRVIFDYELFSDRVPLEGGAVRGAEAVIGAGVLVPGFEEELVGVHPQEQKEFRIRFPATHPTAHLKDKLIEVRATVRDVRNRQLPELNDAFAVSVGSFPNIEALRAALLKNLELEAQQKEEDRRDGELLSVLSSRAKFSDIPDVLTDAEVEKMFLELESSIANEGLSLERYLEMVGKRREDVAKEFRIQAQDRVKSSLLLREIAEAEQLAPSDEEIEEELKAFAQKNEEHRGHSLEEHRPAVRRMLANRKTLLFLRSRITPAETATP